MKKQDTNKRLGDTSESFNPTIVFVKAKFGSQMCRKGVKEEEEWTSFYCKLSYERK